MTVLVGACHFGKTGFMERTHMLAAPHQTEQSGVEDERNANCSALASLFFVFLMFLDARQIHKQPSNKPNKCAELAAKFLVVFSG